MSRYNNGTPNGMGNGGGYQRREHEPLSKTNVFIRGLPPATNDDDLYEMCQKLGTIVSSKSITDRLTNECKGYGFVNFETPNDAANAVRELTNMGYQARMSKETARSDRSFGRRSPPDFRRGPPGPARYGNGNGNMRQFSKTNLYLRGLDANTSDEDLLQLCTRYGNIVSAKAIVDRDTNTCKGYGFVNFDSPYAAEQAVVDLQSRGYQVQMSRENRMPRPPIIAGAPAWGH
ncbi:Protein alan shepard [Fragariocoptes setiger]|uniref:Protein alan shepard n=1 Tax=Fragariocoptes setiger TaxID=1670756 RepID=A0ABQ7SD27_9ACAR|nr:Protein alan shepard [Fragariocoptes setiger]